MGVMEGITRKSYVYWTPQKLFTGYEMNGISEGDGVIG
jgi:hypothetical protein